MRDSLRSPSACSLDSSPENTVFRGRRAANCTHKHTVDALCTSSAISFFKNLHKPRATSPLLLLSLFTVFVHFLTHTHTHTHTHTYIHTYVCRFAQRERYSMTTTLPASTHRLFHELEILLELLLLREHHIQGRHRRREMT